MEVAKKIGLINNVIEYKEKWERAVREHENEVEIVLGDK
jgi:hypothetical protein